MQKFKTPKIKTRYNGKHFVLYRAENLTQQDICVLIGELQALQKKLPRDRNLRVSVKIKNKTKKFFKTLRFMFSNKKGKYCRG